MTCNTSSEMVAFILFSYQIFFETDPDGFSGFTLSLQWYLQQTIRAKILHGLPSRISCSTELKNFRLIYRSHANSPCYFTRKTNAQNCASGAAAEFTQCSRISFAYAFAYAAIGSSFPIDNTISNRTLTLLKHDHCLYRCSVFRLLLLLLLLLYTFVDSQHVDVWWSNRGWYSLVVTHPSTSQQLMCVQVAHACVSEWTVLGVCNCFLW